MVRTPSAWPVACFAGLLVVLALVACGGTGASPQPTATPSLVPTREPTPSAEPTPSLPPGVTPTIPSPTDNDVILGEPDLTRIATGETPAGWVEVLSPNGTCRIAVPGDWDTTLLPGTGSVLLEAQASAFDTAFTSWDEFKNNMQLAYFGADKEILVNDEDTLLMRAGPSAADYSYLLAMNEGDHACGTVSIVTGNSVFTWLETSLKILYTVAPKG